jgi:hypothetical protein
MAADRSNVRQSSKPEGERKAKNKLMLSLIPEIAMNLSHYIIMRNLSDTVSLKIMSGHLLNSQTFLPEAVSFQVTDLSHLLRKSCSFQMRWLEETFTESTDKYICINLHGESKLHHSLKVSTQILPKKLPNGKIEAAKPIFFSKV